MSTKGIKINITNDKIIIFFLSKYLDCWKEQEIKLKLLLAKFIISLTGGLCGYSPQTPENYLCYWISLNML